MYRNRKDTKEGKKEQGKNELVSGELRLKITFSHVIRGKYPIIQHIQIRSESCFGIHATSRANG